MNFNFSSISNDALMWGGLVIVAISTVGMLTSRVSAYMGPPAKATAAPAHANFAWTEGMPYRDRSIWYQWKSDFGVNDPTKRLTVA